MKLNKKLVVMLLLSMLLVSSFAVNLNAAETEYSLDSVIFEDAENNIFVVSLNDYLDALINMNGTLYNYIFESGTRTLKVDIYGVKDNTDRHIAFNDYLDSLISLSADQRTVTNILAGVSDVFTQEEINNFKKPVIEEGKLTLVPYVDVVTFTAADLTVGDTTQDITLDVSGLNGILDLTSANDADVVSEGSVTANEAATLTVTAIKDDQNANCIHVLEAAGVSLTQALTEGKNSLTVIDALDEYLNEGETVTVARLKEAFGAKITIEGTLEAEGQDSVNVSLVFALAQESVTPKFTAADLTVGDTAQNIVLDAAGLNGTLDLTSANDTDVVIEGSVTVNEAATLTVTAIKDDQNADLIHVLEAADVSLTQALTEGKSSLTVIDALSAYLNEGETVTVARLRNAFGTKVTIEGTIAAAGQEPIKVTLIFTLAS